MVMPGAVKAPCVLALHSFFAAAGCTLQMGQAEAEQFETAAKAGQEECYDC